MRYATTQHGVNFWKNWHLGEKSKKLTWLYLPGTAREEWATGRVGRVTAAKGDYDDAINCKKNEFWLFLMELWGGLAPKGMKLFNLYKERAKAGVDRTEYVTNDLKHARPPLHYAPH